VICNEEEIKIMVLTNINFFDYQKKKDALRLGTLRVGVPLRMLI
jgi:hypothetical protein